MKKTLRELRDQIREYVKTIDIKPYSSNLISMTLQKIDKEHGREKASETIDLLSLESLGYKKIRS
tara:strand:+ start:914 stop:1108 length:195 start_codon:yes stop_codon:yes gene_type:complete